MCLRLAAPQVSRNYLSALLHIAPELDAMNVEVVAVSGDPRERAESFVRPNNGAEPTSDRCKLWILSPRLALPAK